MTLLSNTMTSQALWIGFQHFGSRGLGLVIFYLISLHVQPSDLGLMGMAWVLIAVCEAFLSFGINFSYIREREISERDRSSFFWTMLIFGWFWAGVVVCLAPLAGMLYGVEVVKVTYVLACYFPLQSLAMTPMTFLIRDLKFKDLAIREVLCTFVGGLAGVFMAFHGFGVWSLVTRHLVAAAFSVCLLYYFTRWIPRREYDLKKIKKFLRVGLPFALSNNIGWLIGLQFEQAIVGSALGASSLGLLNYAKKPFDVLVQISTGVRDSVIIPLLSRKEREGKGMGHLLFMLYAVAVIAGLLLVAFLWVGFDMLKGYSAISESKWLESYRLMPFLGIVVGVRFVVIVATSSIAVKHGSTSVLGIAIIESSSYVILLFVFAKNGLGSVSHVMLANVLLALGLSVVQLLVKKRSF